MRGIRRTVQRLTPSWNKHKKVCTWRAWKSLRSVNPPKQNVANHIQHLRFCRPCSANGWHRANQSRLEMLKLGQCYQCLYHLYRGWGGCQKDWDPKAPRHRNLSERMKDQKRAKLCRKLCTLESRCRLRLSSCPWPRCFPRGPQMIGMYLKGFPVFAMQTRHIMSIALLKMSRASGMEASLLCIWFPAQSEPGIRSSIWYCRESQECNETCTWFLLWISVDRCGVFMPLPIFHKDFHTKPTAMQTWHLDGFGCISLMWLVCSLWTLTRQQLMPNTRSFAQKLMS